MPERDDTSPDGAHTPNEDGGTGPEPTSSAGAVSPPAWLSDAGRGYWADLYRHLPPAAVTAAEAHALAMLCNALATYAEADEVVQTAGLMLTDPVGNLTPNPALAIRDRAEAAVIRLSTYLRITPNDRDLYAARRPGQPAQLKHRREKAPAQHG